MTTTATGSAENVTRLWRPTRRHVVVAIAALAVLTGSGARPVDATPTFTLERLGGSDRYETAAAIATDAFPAAAGAIIATGETFPDALSASFLAGYVNSPILLVERNAVPAATVNALATLGVKEVVLLGGEAAISKEVEQQLDATYALVRLGGVDRFVTAANVALAINPGDVGELAGKRTAFLTYGYNFPDALAIGPLANAGRFPILLNGSAHLGTPARVALERTEIAHVVIVGGEAVISDVVRQEIAEMGIATSRLSGSDRFATAAAVADFALANLDFVDDHVNLVRGIDVLDPRQGFADALAGSVHAGRELTPLLLTDPTALSAATRTWLAGHASALTDGHVLGGEAAVAQAVLVNAEEVARATTG